MKKALSHEIFNEIEYVIVSLGADGAFAKYKESFYRITIPKIKVMNPVGSGDATMAGLAIGLKQKKSIEETLKLGMTTGMLNTMEKKTGFIDKRNFDNYYSKVHVEKVN